MDSGLNFPAWLKTVSPGLRWDWPFQQLLYEKLRGVTDGSVKRLMIFLPPRHGKSELVTVRYTAHRLQQDPTLNVILGSYNQRLANRFSRKVRLTWEDANLLAVAGGGHGDAASQGDRVGTSIPASPRHPIPASPETGTTTPSSSGGPASSSGFRNRINTVAEWETGAGGGVRAVGVGGGITGFGAKLVVIDDPVKSRAEAESSAYREKVWEWFNDDLYTRLEPDASIILIQTRWHEDDLAGRLQKEMLDGGEHWEIVCLPALAEEPTKDEGGRRKDETEEEGLASSSSLIPHPSSFSADPLGRGPGDALCPERYDRAALLRIRAKLGSYSFSALYQQNPVPLEGGLFKHSWLKRIVSQAPPGLRWCRGYDLAVSTKTSACYTASFRCALDREGNLYIADGFRKRIEFPEQRRYILSRIESESSTEHGIESALHGQAFVQELQRPARLARVPIRAVRVAGDKFTRALAWANRAETGKVILVRGAWIDDFLDEACHFPNGAYDDQVDAVSIAVQMLDSRKRIGYGF